MKSTMIIDKNGDKRWKNENDQLHREDGPAIEYADGSKSWCVNDKCHREDGPAIEYADGTKFWCINGKRHREDGPAIEWADGRKSWCVNDKYHREDGPAIEYSDGSKQWWINGNHHREDGPAIEWADGRKEWWINGKRHRVDGPAIEFADGSTRWYINGVRLTEEEFNKWQVENKKTTSKMMINPFGAKCWKNENGELHREDGPAIECADGTKAWWLNGKRHREDGPAIEHADGVKSWWINDQLHREDGPAVEWTDGIGNWYKNGKLYTKDQFEKLNTTKKQNNEVVSTERNNTMSTKIDCNKIKNHLKFFHIRSLDNKGGITAACEITNNGYYRVAFSFVHPDVDKLNKKIGRTQTMTKLLNAPLKLYECGKSIDLVKKEWNDMPRTQKPSFYKDKQLFN